MVRHWWQRRHGSARFRAKASMSLVAEGCVYYAFQGEEDQPDVRPKAQIVAGFKDFITKFYPANQQQPFIYRQARVQEAAPVQLHVFSCS